MKCTIFTRVFFCHNLSTSLYSGITNTDGVASFSLSGLTSSGTYTCSYSNVSDTCTVTISSYLFYDDCSADNTSDYTDIFRYRYSTVTPTLAFDTDHYVFDASNRSDTFSGFCIPNLQGKDNIRIRVKVKLNSSSAYCQFGLGFADSLQVAYRGAFTFFRIRGDRQINILEGENETNLGSYVSPNTLYYVEIVKQGSNVTFTVYDENMVVVKTSSFSPSNSYSNPYFYIARNIRDANTTTSIYEIMAESI